MATHIVSSPECSPECRLSRNSHRLADKVRILQKLRDNGGRVQQTADENGICVSMLCRWKKDENRLVQTLEEKGCNLRRVSNGPAPHYGQQVESMLKAFVAERREHCLHVSLRILIAHWRCLDLTGTSLLSPSAMRGRVYRFMRRNNLSFRCMTHQAQQCHTNQKDISDFVSYIEEKAKMMGIPPQRVANFDETNVYFAPDFVSTVEIKGKRTVTVCKPNSSLRCTAMIGATMDGVQFPPHVVFKGKSDTKNGKIAREVRNPEHYGHAPTMSHSVQEKAWMDEERMLIAALRIRPIIPLFHSAAWASRSAWTDVEMFLCPW